MGHYKQIFLSTGILLLLVGCASVPVTGRSQLSMVSDQEVISMADQSFSKFIEVAEKKNAILFPSESKQAATLISNVNHVTKRITDVAGLNHINWDTTIIKSKNANAFVMPNGKIVVFTGIMPIAKTESGLATVISHEVAHVMARHQAERISQVVLAQMALTIADIALASSSKTSKYQPVISAGLGLGAQYGILLPYSREHEIEADRIGMYLMAKAGYDPAEAIEFWERMQAMGNKGPWEYLSTHPSTETRITILREYLPEANQYYTRAKPMPDVHVSGLKRSSTTVASPAAYKPSIEPGFWVKYKKASNPNPITQVWKRKESCAFGECTTIIRDDGTSAVFTGDYDIVETINSDGSWVKCTPPMPRIRFPVRIGDNWSVDTTLESSSGAKIRGVVKIDVVDYESVTVPAGSFMVFKIVSTLNNARASEGWYSPETRTFVRTVNYTKGKEVRELIDYQRTDEPAGPMAVDAEKVALVKKVEPKDTKPEDREINKWILVYKHPESDTFVAPRSISYSSDNNTVTVVAKVTIDRSSKGYKIIIDNMKRHPALKNSSIDAMDNFMSEIIIRMSQMEYAIRQTVYFDSNGAVVAVTDNSTDQQLEWKSVKPNIQIESIYNWLVTYKKN